jgi:hypothetical protein
MLGCQEVEQPRIRPNATYPLDAVGQIMVHSKAEKAGFSADN